MNKMSKYLSVGNLNRIIVVISGTFLISLGLYLFLNSHLGLTLFTVMINGLTNTLGLTFGQTSIIFKLGVIILFLVFTDISFGALGFMLGSSLDPGTLVAAMAIGPVTQRVFGVISKVRSSS